jgi:hypothetical protein
MEDFQCILDRVIAGRSAGPQVNLRKLVKARTVGRAMKLSEQLSARGFNLCTRHNCRDCTVPDLINRLYETLTVAHLV